MIDVKDLCFEYPGKRALDYVSFSIEPNTITALVGPNGAGKTTLLRCLAALESPMRGSILMDSWDTDRFPRKVHSVCSYLSDFYGLYDELTVTQILQFFAWSHDCQGNILTLVEETAQRLNIWEYKDVAAGKLSRGLRQKLAIAQTIIHKPKILLLDEPASGLDPEARFNLSKLLITLQKEGMTLIVSSHILSELEDYCTHMLVLQDGKFVKQCALKDIQNPQKAIILKIEFTEDANQYADIVRSIPNISVKTIEKQTIYIEFKGSSQEQYALLKTLIDKQLPVMSIQEQKQRMQDVYISISEEKKSQDKKTKE